MIRFTVGEDYRWDQDLLPYDVVATRAHVKGLVTAGIISESEFEHIGAALDDLLDRYREGEIIVSPEHEDCHTVIEGFLTSELGETGKKVHTGRSRNDQVLAALRLYLRDRLTSIASDAIDLGISLCMLATATDDWVMPGYTHTRQAMPSTLGAWAMGYAELLVGDVELLKETARRINQSPLGSAAGYG
ncbi:MAG: lyase family protein, partial [Rhodothermales bacterium]